MGCLSRSIVGKRSTMSGGGISGRSSGRWPRRRNVGLKRGTCWRITYTGSSPFLRSTLWRRWWAFSRGKRRSTLRGPLWGATRTLPGTIAGLGGTLSPPWAEMRRCSASLSARTRRKIAVWIRWTCGKRGRLSAAHSRTALSGSTFFKPPALPEVADWSNLLKHQEQCIYRWPGHLSSTRAKLAVIRRISLYALPQRVTHFSTFHPI